MTRIFSSNFVALVLLAPAVVLCQVRGPDAQLEMARQMTKLQVTLELDRKIYFPGEDATLTITVANPTTGALQALNPFGFRIWVDRYDPTRQNQYQTEWLSTAPDEGDLGLELPPL